MCIMLFSVYISLPSLHDRDVKRPNFTFYGGRGRGRFMEDNDVRFSFSELSYSPLEFPNIKQIV